MLVPPENYGLVEPGVHRCSKLEAENFPFLSTLRLNLLVLLDAAKPPRTLSAFLEENKVSLYNLGGLKIRNHQITGKESDKDDSSKSLSSSSQIPVVLLRRGKSTNDQWMLIEKNLLIEALELLFDKTKYPMLIVDSSLTFVGILRKIQRWNFSSIVNEYRIYTGNSSKNNYNVENFLELVQCELIPSEVQHKREPESHRNTKGSLDESAMDDDNSAFAVDYEDEIDEDVLSASPQIPANLLKLVELQQGEKLPSGSPGARMYTGRHSSYEHSHARRKLSVDSRYIRNNNNRFRNPSFSLSISPGRRPSLESGLRQFKLERERSAKSQENLNFKYYRPAEVPDQTKVIQFRLPEESKLADWFVSGRDFWEKNCREDLP